MPYEPSTAGLFVVRNRKIAYREAIAERAAREVMKINGLVRGMDSLLEKF